MKQLELNIVRSFQLAKSDIIKLQNDVQTLKHAQGQIMDMLDNIKKEIENIKHRKKSKAIVKTTIKKSKFVASKGGSKFHTVNCPFAQNIKPKSKVIFSSKTKALNDGYKPCDCVK